MKKTEFEPSNQNVGFGSAVVMLLVCIVIVSGFAFFIPDISAKVDSRMTEKAKPAENKFKPIEPAQSKQVEKIAAPVSDLATKQKLANIGGGGGFCRSFTAQIIADPESFGFKGNITDAAALKEWAGKRAFQFVRKYKLFDPRFNIEARVNEANKISPVLEKDSDGNFVCNIFVAGTDGTYSDTPSDVLSSNSSPSVDFLASADEDGNFNFSQSYLYSWSPV
jgi:hypothetical protein